jgi:hypothetical protein
MASGAFNKAVTDGTLLTVAAAILLMGEACPHPDGDCVGVITKLSLNGAFNKVWEGELAVDNFKSLGNECAMSSRFVFSVADVKLAPQLQTLQESGARISLHYEQSVTNLGCNADRLYHVTRVKILPPAATVATPKL